MLLSFWTSSIEVQQISSLDQIPSGIFLQFVKGTPAETLKPGIFKRDLKNPPLKASCLWQGRAHRENIVADQRACLHLPW
ncbi:hypothetical protein Y1Q_0003170 [Alligator mississippiensis]|uniref:Uncharacterized protein n=1 Tax=Alligator mississippiensis TaxID=8496 RepID=A0A151MDQ1_ALLMI|nr:hypothetical protein Y1Q_0003170 [Alligator mississippiensis]